MATGEYALAYRAFAEAMRLLGEGTAAWATAARCLYDTRDKFEEQAAEGHGTMHVYAMRDSAIEQAAAPPPAAGGATLPEKKPDWMETAEAAATMAARVVWLLPNERAAWRMQGDARWELADTMSHGTREEKDALLGVLNGAVVSYTRAMQIAKRDGNAAGRGEMADILRRAIIYRRRCENERWDEALLEPHMGTDER